MIAPSLERPTCLNRSSLDSILSPPPGNDRVCLGFVPLGPNHPRVVLKIEFPDEIHVFSHVAVQRRMLGLVHRDLESANGPFGHISPTICYHVITRSQAKSNLA